jgi:signal transduction histidine kinase
MSGRPFSRAHRVAASGTFSLFLILSIVLDSSEVRALALALGGSLLSLFLFTRTAAEKAFGSFLTPFASVIDLALLFCVISLTGNARSPFAFLLPVGVGLSWQLQGKTAARFYAALSLLGVAALLGLGAVRLSAPQELFAVLAMGLSGPALLVALEAASGGRPSVSEAPGEGVAEGALAANAPTRDREAEILHDLRSPLSVIRVYSDLIREGARRGELPHPEHLANLAREIELAERLVGGTDSYSSVSKDAPGPPPATPPPQTADLVEILGSLATAYRLAHSGRLRIEFIAERPQLPVSADPVALQRAFRNVLDNAIKYTGEGGEVRIRAGAAGPDAFVVVKDTGMGMTQEERTHAFEYAFRGSGAVASGQRGQGLGLALTKEILEANGGRIALSSEAGFGSEVTILIPFQKAAR